MKIALVTTRNEIKNMYVEELNSVFSGYLDIIPYSLEIDHKYNKDDNILREAKVVLLTNPNLFITVKHLVNENSKILYLDSAFLKNKIESLKSFHKNTKALICFNFYSVSKQAATAIYEMGVTNLNLSLYNPDSPNLDDNYDIAIVGESSAIVPDKIKTIVSLGRRKISFNTLMNLAIATNTLDDKLENRIHEYCEELAMPGNAIDNLFVNSSYPKIDLKNIIDNIEDSIVIFNNNFEILNYNKSLTEMFNIKESLMNKRIDKIPALKQINQYIANNIDAKNLLVEIEQNKRVMLTVKKIENILKNHSYIALIKDVTKIIQLENTLRNQLQKKGLTAKHDFSHIYGNSAEIKKCIEKAKIISKLDKTVLIIGESGTGKELFAQSMHNNSPRSNYPFVGINCAALPSSLLESELFGYVEGAFTGAKKGGKEGLFQYANNGTLFLDEIGDMPIETQAKILRVLEEREFMKLGSGEVVQVNVRIIAATNRNLKELIAEGKFRKDLYYRLNTFMLNIPPLRKRKGDILYLINLFAEELSNEQVSIDKNVLDFLRNYTWDGNARELKNCVEYMVSISNGHVKMEHIPEYMLEESDYEIDTVEDDVFYMLNGYEREIVTNMIKLIDCYSMGRRKLYSKLKNQFPDLSEYKVRSLINDVLVENNIVQLGSGRSGMKLTDKGQEIMQQF